MTDKDIVLNLKKLFGEAASPGQAFDAIVTMRQAGVTWNDAYRAITTHGRALQRLDENEDESSQSERPQSSAKTDPKFKNPVLTFGQYQGKTLLEVSVIRPSYLTWLEQNSRSEFWRQQATMAKIAAEVQAPIERDTADTGYFG
jgi:hypothetical protein